MGWSNAFISELYKTTIQPVFELRFHDLGNGIGRDYSVYSHGTGNLKIARSGVNVSGVTVTPSSWNVSFGGFSVRLVGDSTNLFLAVQKGSFASLYCKLGSSNYERIAIGQLKAIRRTGVSKELFLQFVDLLSALQNTVNSEIGSFPSLSTLNPPQQDWFYELGTFTQLTSNWTVGDSSMAVTNTTAIRRETGQNGIIKCQSNSSSDPFFLEFNNTTGTSISTTPNSGTAVFPSITSAYNLNTSTGSFVTRCAQLDDHPVDMIGKILESTGTGGNGLYDTLPSAWSIGGVFGSGLFDYNDGQTQKSLISGSATTNYKWRLVLDSPLNRGFRSILDKSKEVGQWAVFRQGSVSWRSCTDPNTAPFVAGKLQNRDIFAVIAHDIFDPNQSNIYPISKLEYSSSIPLNSLYRHSIGQTSGRVSSLPASREIIRSAQTLYSPDTNESDLALADLTRMAKWDHFTYERVTLRCKMVTAQFVAGDILELDTDLIQGLNGNYRNTQGMVVASAFDFSTNSSMIQICVISGER
tara:strand:- start:18422 stop:19996 length:1575 start_codon:yes stop_codon:yes gene_type:complete